MRRRDIKVGMKIDHRLPGGEHGKHLGTVTLIGRTVVSYRKVDGTYGVATPQEVVPTEPDKG